MKTADDSVRPHFDHTILAEVISRRWREDRPFFPPGTTTRVPRLEASWWREPLEDLSYTDWKRLLVIHLDKVVAKEGAKHGIRANFICPGFVRTPPVDKQIPEQARTLGISEQAVIKDIMLKETVDGEFTTAQDVAEAALFFASFQSNALTGQSVVVSHGWYMQ